MKRITLITPITLVNLSIVASLRASQANADEISFGIYPQVTKLPASPGELKETEIIVKNTMNESITLTPLIQSFTPSSNENGQVVYEQTLPDFLESVQVLDGSEPVSEITLGPKAEKSLTVRLTVPTSEKPGDHYFSIILISRPKLQSHDQQTESASAYTTLSGGIASHILLSVNPEQIQTLSLTEFSTPAFSQKSPVPFHIRLTNQTKHFSQVESVLEIQNILGQKIEQIVIPETTILSQSTRSLTSNPELTQSDYVKESLLISNTVSDDTGKPVTVLQNDLFPGVYKAKLVVTGQTLPTPITGTTYFLVAPIELLIVLLFGLIFLYVLKTRIIKRLKK